MKSRSKQTILSVNSQRAIWVIGFLLLCTSGFAQHLEAEREVFEIVEEFPVYQEGNDVFYNNIRKEIRYPVAARRDGIEGKVYAEFVIERDGSLSNIQTIKGIGGGCGEEVVRVISTSSSFIPGSQRGRTVRVKMVMPVVFMLDETKKNKDGTFQGTIVVGDMETNMGSLSVEANYSNGVWSGVIKSPEGDLLPGANVIAKGTDFGTVSDLDGTFNLEIDKSTEIEVRFVGYKSVYLGKS